MFKERADLKIRNFRRCQFAARIAECHPQHSCGGLVAFGPWAPVRIQMVCQMRLANHLAALVAPDDRMNERVRFFAVHIVIPFDVQGIRPEIAVFERDNQIVLTRYQGRAMCPFDRHILKAAAGHVTIQQNNVRQKTWLKEYTGVCAQTINDLLGQSVVIGRDNCAGIVRSAQP